MSSTFQCYLSMGINSTAVVLILLGTHTHLGETSVILSTQKLCIKHREFLGN